MAYQKGYVGAPILTWHGYIVDGHNRYELCQQLGIHISDDHIEDLNLGDSAGELDAMDWMLTHQLSSKNLSAAERIQMAKAFEEEIRLENEKKMLSGCKLESANKSDNIPCLQLEAGFRDRSLNTERQIAKKAGVSTGTVARYNRIMKSGTDEQKAAVRTGQKTINKAYTEIRQRESTL